MGYYPYAQECIHGHQWGAVFTSYDMRDTGQKRCPECGCYKVRTVWNIPGDCYVKHSPQEWQKEKEAIKKGKVWRPNLLEWDEPNEETS